MGDGTVAGVAFDAGKNVVGADGRGVTIAGGKPGLLWGEDRGDFELWRLRLTRFREAVFVPEFSANGEEEGVTVSF